MTPLDPPHTEHPAVFVEGSERQPWDICECGDYRSDHEGGVGECDYGNHHMPRHVCNRFKFAWRSAADEATWRKARNA